MKRKVLNKCLVFSMALFSLFALRCFGSGAAHAQQELLVSAAASPTNAFTDVGTQFEAANPLPCGRRLRKELLDIQEEFHVPLIMITHDPEDIKAFAQTLVTYEAGTVCEIQHSLNGAPVNKELVIPDDLSAYQAY
jgi:hypothetical protein